LILFQILFRIVHFETLGEIFLEQASTYFLQLSIFPIEKINPVYDMFCLYLDRR